MEMNDITTAFKEYQFLRETGWTQKDKEFLDKFDTKYVEKSPHIALEYADKLQQWEAFRYILNTHRSQLWTHFQITSFCFDYNINKLPKEEKEKIIS
jgi:hypothetical protein